MSHEHSPEKQKQYFEFAYQTGSDIWSHIPYRYVAQAMMPDLEPDSMVLDIGAGRGLWAIKLLEAGYRVLGIDYVTSIVNAVNYKITEEGFIGRGRFMVANALDIPFTNSSFPMVTDIGTFQHVQSQDWEKYMHEVHRVIQDGGYYLNVSLSRRTHRFQGFSPSVGDQGEFHKFGVHYYFFTEGELQEIFETHFIIIDQRFETYESKSDPADDVVLVFTLMQKKTTQ